MCQDWDLMLRLTARRRPLELPALACLYSTTAPTVEQSAESDVRNPQSAGPGSHGAPAEPLGTQGAPADQQSGRIDHDMAFCTRGGCGRRSDRRAPCAVGTRCRNGDHPARCRRDGARSGTSCWSMGSRQPPCWPGELAAARRPFAVRVTQVHSDAKVAGTFGHSLFLGLWHVREEQTAESAEGFLDELAERLRIWKLDLSKD